MLTYHDTSLSSPFQVIAPLSSYRPLLYILGIEIVVK